MPRDEFLLTDYVRSFPDLVGSIDVFTGGDKEHRALLEELEAGGDWTAHLTPGEVVLPSSVCHPLYGALPKDVPGRGARRGVLRLVVPARAQPRPGPDADLPDLRVRARSARRSSRSPTATRGSSAGLAALTGARAAGALRGGQRPVLRPGRQDAGRQPARPPRSSTRCALDLTDGQADRDRLVELPRGPLRPRLRPAPRRRHPGAQRLHRLRPGPDHAGPVRHARHGPRRPGRKRCGPRSRADRRPWSRDRATGPSTPRCGSGPSSVRSTAGSRGRPAAWPAAARSCARRWGRRAGPRTGRSAGWPRSWPRPGSSRSASTTTAPVTPPACRTTRTGCRAGWPASRRPASTSSTSAPRTSPRSACGSARRWPPARPPRRRRSSSLVCWDPCLSGRTFLREGEALYAFGDTRCRGARRRAAAHARLPVRRRRPPRRCARSTSPSSRPTSRSRDRVLLLTRDDRPVRPGDRGAARAGGDAARDRSGRRPGPAARRTARAQRRPEEALRAVVAWLADGVADQPAVPVKTPDAEHAVLVGSGPAARRRCASGRPGSARSASSALVDEPADLAAARGRPVPWVVLVNVAAEHHIGPGRRWVEFARRWAALGYRVRAHRPERHRATAPPSRASRGRPAFAPEWIDDMREVVTDLAADGAQVVIVGLCSGAYSAFEVAMWEHVDAVFAINPRLTLYPAAKGTPRLHRPAARGDGAEQAVRRPRAPAPDPGRRPLADLPPVRGVARAVPGAVAGGAPRHRGRGDRLPGRRPALHRGLALRPLLWWMRRNPRFRLRRATTCSTTRCCPGTRSWWRTSGPPSSSTVT